MNFTQPILFNRGKAGYEVIIPKSKLEADSYTFMFFNDALDFMNKHRSKEA